MANSLLKYAYLCISQLKATHLMVKHGKTKTNARCLIKKEYRCHKNYFSLLNHLRKLFD